MDRLLKAGDIVTTLATVVGVFGWIAAAVTRFILRRPVSFQEWVLHAAGLGGAAGLVTAVLYLVT